MHPPEKPGDRPDGPRRRTGGADGTPGSFHPPGTNTLAVVALVIAVANVVFGSFLGLFVPLVPAAVAVVVVAIGHTSLKQITRSGEAGREMAVSALVIGYLCLAGVAAFLLMAFTFTTVGMALLGY